MACFRRGDIVWARARYPHSWWPALVLRIDILGVLVSFFDADPPPRYFLESELRSFEQSFSSLVGTINRGTICDEMLSRALVLLRRRAALSLTCPCQEPPERESKGKDLAGCGWDCGAQVVEAANWFVPAEVLGFVLDAAVSPWIEDEGLFAAVTVSAEIKRFRRYSSMKQKLIYMEEREVEEDTVTIPEEGVALGDECRLLSVNVDANTTDCITNGTNVKEFLEPLHNVEVNCLQLKRQLEQPHPVHPCFKLRKTRPFFSLSRAFAYLLENGDSVNIHLFDAVSSWSQFMFDVPLIENGSRCRSIVEIGNIKGRENSVDVANEVTFTTPVNMLEPQGSNVSSIDEGMCKSYPPGATKGAWNVDVKVDSMPCFLQPSAPKLLLKNMLGNHVGNEEVGNANVVITKHMLLPHLNIDPYKIQSKNCDSPSSATNNEVKVKFHQSAAADLSLSSQLDEQPKAPKYGHSTILYMKFPKGYYRPSKEELIKRFSSFGSVDPSNTTVSPYSGAAKVVFLHHIDAVTAYQYAKRKKVFRAQANVQFSLDPFNYKKEVQVRCKMEGVKRKDTQKRKACVSLFEIAGSKLKKVHATEPNEEVLEHNDETTSQYGGGNKPALQQYTRRKPVTRSNSQKIQKSPVQPTPIQSHKAKPKYKTCSSTMYEDKVLNWVQTVPKNRALAQFDSKTVIFGDTAATMMRARGWICNMLMRYACAWLNNSLFKHDQKKWAFPPQYGEIVASELGIPVSAPKNIQGLKWDTSRAAEESWFKDNFIGFSLHICHMVFHPVLLYKHWFLICLNIRAKKVEVLNSIPNYYNPEPGYPQKLVDFDRFVRREVELLGELVAASSENPPPETLHGFKEWKIEYPPSPLQPNSWDCGLYVINFMKLYDGDANQLADAFVNGKFQTRKELLLEMLLSDVNKLKTTILT